MSNQVFVRNLSYNCTEEELTSVFEGCGPLKRVSLAKEADGRNKGFGFVKFSLPEDAANAVQELQGREMGGRPLKLELAVKKGTNAANAKKEEIEALKATKQSQPTVEASSSHSTVKSRESDGKKRKLEDEGEKKTEVHSKDRKKKTDTTALAAANSIKTSRQVLIFGCPDSLRASVIQAVIAAKDIKRFKVKLIQKDNPLFETLCLETIHPAGRAFIVDTSSKVDSLSIVELLNSTPFQALVPEEKEESSRKHRLKCCLMSEVTEKELRRRRCRLIVRNLAFQATETLVKESLDIFGPIIEVTIPLIAVKTGENSDRKTPRGFCFVTYLCEKDAQSAVLGSNIEAAEGISSESAAKKGVKICNRLVAVDFCEAKDRFLNKGTQEGKEDVDDIDKDKMSEEDAEDGATGGDGDDDVNSAARSDDDEESHTTDKEEEEDEEDEKKLDKKSNDVEEGCTVFVRDLAFDTQPLDLKKAFSRFGHITLALLVKDKDTGLCKGSAFVKFKDPSAASASVQEVGDDRTGPPLLINGRPCRVALAVDKESAGKLKGDEKLRLDKRHIYLASEGYIAPSVAVAVGSKRKGEAAEGSVELSAKDKEMRERYHAENKKKLLNPMFFVSPTRILIRNLSKFVTDVKLRTLCMEATRAGMKKNLVGERDIRALLAADGNNGPSKAELSIPVVNGKALKTAKVMLDLQRLKDGKPQSRGFGFVDFTHHLFALACLRELNNNPAYVDMASDGLGGTSETPVRGAGKARLIVEFALENKRKVMILEAREKNNLPKGGDAKEEGSTPKKKKTTAAGGISSSPLSAEKRKLQGKDEDSVNRPSKKAKANREGELTSTLTGASSGIVDTVRKSNAPREDLTPAARKRKQDQRRREKEKKRKLKREAKAAAGEGSAPGASSDNGKPSWGGFKRLRAGRKKG